MMSLSSSTNESSHSAHQLINDDVRTDDDSTVVMPMVRTLRSLTSRVR